MIVVLYYLSTYQMEILLGVILGIILGLIFCKISSDRGRKCVVVNDLLVSSIPVHGSSEKSGSCSQWTREEISCDSPDMATTDSR